MLSYLSRYVFRTAISNARILGMDQSHVTFRWKDRNANGWRTERLPGVEFLRRFLQHVLPRGFHKVRYYGLWHPSKRGESNRAWVLLILATPADTAQPPRMVSLSEALSHMMELTDRPIDEVSITARLSRDVPNAAVAARSSSANIRVSAYRNTHGQVS